MSSYTGKALLIFHKNDCKYVPYDVRAYVQSCSSDKPGARCMVAEDFELCATATWPLPPGTSRMQVGDRVWISVVYEITYLQDWEGDWDVDIEYVKARTLKRKRA